MLSIIVTDLVGVELLGPAYGFLTTIEGISSLLGPPVSGKYQIIIALM